MNLSLRAKIALIGGLILIGLVALFGISKVISIFSAKKEAPPIVQEQLADETIPLQSEETDVRDTSKIPYQANEAPPAQKRKDDVSLNITAFVMPFVDHFGSYSNQSNFENFSNIMPFMTKDMQAWAQKKIDEALAAPLATIYKGITTRSFSYSGAKIDDKIGEAEVTISTQRKDFVGDGANFKVYNQDIRVKLKKESGQWLVDSAEWK